LQSPLIKSAGTTLSGNKLLSQTLTKTTIRRSTTMAVTTGGANTIDNRSETVSLIGSDKVDGTAVYGADDQKIGAVQRVMIDKISGKVAYAVISFGGFLGMGEDYYPMPWPNLKYDTRLGGYRVGITEDQLRGAPKFNRNTDWDWSDRSRDRAVYGYYDTPLWY
jgi:PRC-barrel domain